MAAPQQRGGTWCDRRVTDAPALLRLHVQGSRLTRLVAPTVHVDDAVHPVGFGANHIAVRADDTVRVRCESEWAGTPTRTELVVATRAGDTVDVWYSLPSPRAPQGALALEPVRSRSFGLIVAIVAVVVLLVLLAGVLPVLIGGA